MGGQEEVLRECVCWGEKWCLGKVCGGQEEVLREGVC